MAKDRLCKVRTYPADTDMSNDATKQWTFVAIANAQNVEGNGIGNAAIIAPDGTHRVIGILQNNPFQGQAGSVAIDGESQIRALTAWKVGDGISVGTGGYGQKAGSSDTVVAYATEDAAPGDISSCEIII